MNSPARPSVAVIGGGLAGLVAAREAAIGGARVRVFEAGARLGGCLRRERLGGIDVEVGAESVAVRGSAVPELLTELGLDADVTQPAPLGSWLFRSDGVAVPAPKTGPLGLPATPWAADVRRVIGIRGACRASWDALAPRIPVRGAHERAGAGHPATLGQLVRARLGDTVYAELVAPVTRGVYSMDPDQVPVSMVPGLTQALAASGRLSRAAAALREQAPPGARVFGLVGGMSTLVDALVADLRTRGVELRTNAAVSALTPHPDGGWILRLPSGVSRASGVIIAASESPSSRLLTALTGHRLRHETPGFRTDPEASTAATPERASPRVTVVSLLVRAPELDRAPRGTGVLVAQPGARVAAKALTHASAKWAWVADRLSHEPGRHLLRLSYGSAPSAQEIAEDEAGDDAGDDDLVMRALRDASILTGVPLERDRLLDSHSTQWAGTLPAGSAEAQLRREAHQRELALLPGIEATGAWIAGTGIAAVVPHARATAQRLLSALDFPRATTSASSADAPPRREGATMPQQPVATPAEPASGTGTSGTGTPGTGTPGQERA